MPRMTFVIFDRYPDDEVRRFGRSGPIRFIELETLTIVTSLTLYQLAETVSVIVAA